MSKYIINGETLEGIADAIREKTGGTDPLTLTNIMEAISTLSGGDDAKKIYVGQTTASIIDRNTLKVVHNLGTTNIRLAVIFIEGPFSPAGTDDTITKFYLHTSAGILRGGTTFHTDGTTKNWYSSIAAIQDYAQDKDTFVFKPANSGYYFRKDTAFSCIIVAA